MSETPRERFQENATEIASILVTGIWLLALLSNQDWWLWAMLGGYVVVLPIVKLLFGEEDEDETEDGESSRQSRRRRRRSSRRRDETQTTDETAPEGTNNRDALDTLKDRYARGELTDEQFERKLEKLMENDTMENVEERFQNGSRERNLERE